jgi:hypothetical protein
VPRRSDRKGNSGKEKEEETWIRTGQPEGLKEQQKPYHVKREEEPGGPLVANYKLA